MSPDKNAFIKATKQAWKMHLGNFLMLITTVVIFILAVYGDKINFIKNLKAETFAIIVGLGLLIGLLSFIWMCVSIKCPLCKAKLYWYSVSKINVKGSVEWFENFQQCPVCHSTYPNEIKKS